MTVSCPVRQAPTAYESGQCANRYSLRPGGIDLTCRAVALCDLRVRARVLDVGCGSGESTAYLHRTLGIDAIGMDLSASACGLSRRRDRELTIVRADAVRLPFAAATMDALIAECVISLIDDKSAAIAECNRVLKPCGRLAITDMYARRPDATRRLCSLDGVCVSRMINPSELEGELAKHSFSIEAWEDHSYALRELVARFVFEQGSLEQLWTSSHTKPGESQQISDALKGARPGYFLLVASKREGGIHRGEQS